MKCGEKLIRQQPREHGAIVVHVLHATAHYACKQPNILVVSNIRLANLSVREASVYMILLMVCNISTVDNVVEFMRLRLEKVFEGLQGSLHP